MNVADVDIVSDLNGDIAGPPADSISANAGDVPAHRGSEPLATPVDATKVVEAPAAAKPLSLRDQISSALKGEGETPPASTQDGGPVRNPDGTFAPKPAADPAAAAPATVVPVPQGLGLDAATFASLPAETQQHVARTMDTLNQQAAQYAAYSQIEQVIAPRRQGWALAGMSDGQVINQLFALSDFAEKTPEDFIRYFAQQRDIDLEDLAFGPEPVDPTIAAYDKRIKELETQLGGITTQQQQQAHNGLVDEIVSFADEKGADGTPLRPYFGELGDTVLPHIQLALQRNPNAPRTQILSEAYDAACWGNPSIRAKMQKTADDAAAAQRIKEQQAAAGRARNAGVSVSGGTPGDAPAAATGSSGNLREDIRASMRAAT